jgi:formate hydrogenlyase subunit 3/multisubunit Na+/H+ antiporter MnhD subunit
VRGAVHPYSPADLGSPLLPIALLCLVFTLLAFLVGPRARTVLMGLVLAGAFAMIPLSFVVHKPVAGTGRVEMAAGRIVAPIGAVFALGGAAAAIPLSARVRRVGMPETGPQEPE